MWQLAKITRWGTKFWLFRETQLPRYSSDQWILYIPTSSRLLRNSLPSLLVSSSAKTFSIPQSMVEPFISLKYGTLTQFQNAFFQGATDMRRETLRGSSRSCLHSFLHGCKDKPPAPVLLQGFAVTPLTVSGSGSAQLPLLKGDEKAAHERFFPLNTWKLQQHCSFLGCIASVTVQLPT